ncbi:unnamed protein product [Microthlaspi erraticum]|uniref:Uncharacterized protein n=1 Tax=Microthlaspi erraticum TaxID=1685480 RepID=A0A6D2JQA6_9BRAS|nr:unnamed protein product [Microthlaspi erraticum]
MATQKQEYDGQWYQSLNTLFSEQRSHYKKTTGEEICLFYAPSYVIIILGDEDDDGDEEVSSVFKALPKLKDEDDALSSTVDWRFSPIERKEKKKKSDDERSISVSTQREIFDLSAKGQFGCFSGRSQESAIGSV